MSAEKILVVDDEPSIREIVTLYLKRSGYEVTTAADGLAAVDALARQSFDLVVLDLMLPDHDGWDVTRTVRGDPALAATPIIMVTARVEDTDRIVGLELGADDYVTKPFNPREIVARVRAILRRTSGAAALPARHLHAGRLVLDPDQHEATLDGQPLDLTPTEFALLHTLLANAGHAFTRAELIEQALGYNYDGLDRTVDSHIKNLRRKIELDPADPALIQTVYGVGYRLRREGSL